VRRHVKRRAVLLLLLLLLLRLCVLYTMETHSVPDTYVYGRVRVCVYIYLYSGSGTSGEGRDRDGIWIDRIGFIATVRSPDDDDDDDAATLPVHKRTYINVLEEGPVEIHKITFGRRAWVWNSLVYACR